MYVYVLCMYVCLCVYVHLPTCTYEEGPIREPHISTVPVFGFLSGDVIHIPLHPPPHPLLSHYSSVSHMLPNTSFVTFLAMSSNLTAPLTLTKCYMLTLSSTSRKLMVFNIFLLSQLLLRRGVGLVCSTSNSSHSVQVQSLPRVVQLSHDS